MRTFEKHKKLLAVALCACTLGSVFQTVRAYEAKPGWHGEGKDRYYILESTRQEATGLTTVDNDVYYFDKEGNMQFGWQTIANNTYYFEADGTAATGKAVVSGQEYFFQKDGELKQGWSADGKSYFNENGFEQSKAWIDVDGARYYLGDKGEKLIGWQEIDGQKYYFGPDGKLFTGVQTVDGQEFTFGEDGVLRTGWQDEGENRVYYNENGVRATGVQSIDNNYYVFDDNGAMVRNNPDYQGYVVDESGVITSTVTPEQVAQPEPQAAVEQPAAPVEAYQAPVQQAPAPAPAPVEAAPVATDRSSAIAAAALAQVGRTQDCTMLATNSLAAVGINFHDWPSGYLSLGTQTSNPVPGDLVVYNGHVAVYVGNGQAVHGGWLGSQTVVSSVECTNALVGYVHVN